MKRLSLLLVIAILFTSMTGCTEVESKGNNGTIPPDTVAPSSSPTQTSEPFEGWLPSVSEIQIADTLPKFDSFDAIVERLSAFGYEYVTNDMLESAVSASDGGSNSQVEGAAPSSSESKGDHSTTNVQKEGVDESDVIKTDGDFIYTVNGNTVAIVGVSGADMKQYSTIRVDDRLRISDIYVVDNRLVVTGTFYKEEPLPKLNDDNRESIGLWYPEYVTRMYTVFHIYDISDRQKPTMLQEYEISGTILSTRVIGDTLYYVTTHAPSYVPFEVYLEQDIDVNYELVLPGWKNSVVSDTETVLTADRISYFPDTKESNFMLIGTLSLSGVDKSEPQAYFGGGTTLYMDTEYMAIACELWGGRWSSSAHTRVYRFTLARDGVVYTANAEASGRIIDQYAMDVYNDNLRIATSNTSGNKVSVFDKDMKLLGETDGFAESEQVRSARFMGDMVYVVTFRNTDPLFCIDLSNPSKPEILGELKIPGFSQYLHPIGDGLLVGFGRSTVENDWGGFTDIGFKISLFDVNNPRDPVELSVLEYSDEEYYSEAFTDPRSLLVDAKKGWFAFPVLGIIYPDGFDPTIPDNDIDEYLKGVYPDIWYGAVVVEAKDNALNEVTQIKHGILSVDEYERNYSLHYNPMQLFTVRSVYIGDTLYTVGNGIIVAHDYTTFEKLDELKLN